MFCDGDQGTDEVDGMDIEDGVDVMDIVTSKVALHCFCVPCTPLHVIAPKELMFYLVASTVSTESTRSIGSRATGTEALTFGNGLLLRL